LNPTGPELLPAIAPPACGSGGSNERPTPFCDDLGFREPEDSVNGKWYACIHFRGSEGGVATFEGLDEEWNGDGKTLFDFGTDMMRLSAEGTK
jgi:hypothetical protein